MNLSIVLCTYNGARTLEAQFLSLLGQSRPPDEIIICDDASSDHTWPLIQQLTARSHVPCRPLQQPHNLGSTSNFNTGIQLAQGDIVFLCDQDDVWAPDKLKSAEDLFKARPEVGMLFSDAQIVDDALIPSSDTLWTRLGLTREERQRMKAEQLLDVLLRRNVVTGATMAFRTLYRDLVSPIPASWVHDAWIALLVSSVAPCAAIDKPLIQYRQHANQQIGEQRRRWYRQFLKARSQRACYFQATTDNFALAAHRLRAPSNFKARPEALAGLDAKINHWRRRTEMRSMRWRWPAVVAEWKTGTYDRYSLGWKSVVQDLFL